MSPNRVGFFIHPTSAEYVRKTFPEAETDADVDALLRSFQPALDYSARVTSLTGAEVEVFVYGIPLLPKDFVTLPREEVMRHLLAAAQLAKRDGVQALGLAAFTSIVPAGGVQIERTTGIPCTSGNTYTAAIAVRGLLQVAEEMEQRVGRSTIAVVGATGSVGSPCVDLIAAHRPRKLVLFARNAERLAKRAELVAATYGVDVSYSTNLDDIREADIVFVAASATSTLLEPRVLKAGAIVCDVSVPHAVSHTIFEQRPDVFVMEGGFVRVDPRVIQSLKVRAYETPNGIHVSSLMPCAASLSDGVWAACFAETFLIGFEGRFENVGLGTITAEQARTMETIGRKHGMTVAPEKITLFAELLGNPRLAEEARNRFLAARAAKAAA